MSKKPQAVETAERMAQKHQRDIQQVAANRFRVGITDNGPGIVRAQIPRIFCQAARTLLSRSRARK